MGQAKQRGTFEERKSAAVERNKKQRLAMLDIQRRKPSPKHVALMGMIAATMAGASQRSVSRSPASRLSHSTRSAS
jgi:hypothetical protein